MQLRCAILEQPSVAAALSVGPSLLSSLQTPTLVTSIFTDEAIVLGALQLHSRVVSSDRVPVYRRCTTGTAVYLSGRSILWTLALPAVNSLVSDATMRTLINRNVRGFLQGFTRSGALAHYFGREWISVKHHPAVVLGVEHSQNGILLEAFCGFDQPLALPKELCTEREAQTDRWLGKLPVSMQSLLPSERGIESFAQSVQQHFAAKWNATVVPFDPVFDATIAPEKNHSAPAPEDTEFAAPSPCPIGWIDVGISRETSKLWIGGDLLVSRNWLEQFADRRSSGSTLSVGEEDFFLEGASVEALRTAGVEELARMRKD